MAREVQEWSELQFVQNRYTIWLGAENPKTVSSKEVIDNGIDQIADKKAKEVRIFLSPQKVAVFDNGGGISLGKSDKSNKSFLMLAVNKLYTSSNYEGTELTGTNGVGATVTNYMSDLFKAGHIKGNEFKGYIFKEGIHISAVEDEEAEDEINIESTEGNRLLEGVTKGFYVEAEFSDRLIKDKIDLSYLIDYIKHRTGELPKNSKVTVFEEKDGETKIYEFDKIQGSENYQPSWEEAVKEVPTAQIVNTRSGWRFAFCEDKYNFNGIKSMVQGAPVQNKSFGTIPFMIEDHRVTMQVPYTFYYKGKENPEYHNQTKDTVKIGLSDYHPPFKALKELYRKYYLEAERSYLAKMLTDSKSSMYYPADPDVTEDQELIISEGFSAMSNIKNKRKYKTQACFALRGKFLNVMQMDLRSAMKSDVVRDLLNILLRKKFERIILTPDADADGAHICTLLLAVIHKYAPSYLEEGKVYYCKTPLFVFENNKTKDLKWSNEAADCPPGYVTNPKKGLGSYTMKEIKMFVTDPETRELWRFTADDIKDIAALEFALIEGGKQWIIH